MTTGIRSPLPFVRYQVWALRAWAMARVMSFGIWRPSFCSMARTSCSMSGGLPISSSVSPFLRVPLRPVTGTRSPPRKSAVQRSPPFQVSELLFWRLGLAFDCESTITQLYFRYGDVGNGLADPMIGSPWSCSRTQFSTRHQRFSSSWGSIFAGR